MVDGLGRLDGWQSVVGGAMEYSVLEGSVEALTIGTGVSCSNVEYETVNSECPLNESYRDLGDDIERVSDRLDSADDQLENDDLDEAAEVYETVEDRIDDLADRIHETSFEEIDADADDLLAELETLRHRCEDGLKTVRERRRPGAPAEITGPPDLDVTYEALERQRLIGKGGNADVYLMTAEADEAQPELAVKEPRFSGTLHTETVDRILREAQTWAKLDDHDHVVGVVDYGSEPLPWIAMEYMDGGDLSDRVGAVDLREGLWIGVAITDAITHAHRRGVSHIDLKPENVLFRTTPGDDWDVPKVADWGLAKMLLEHSKSIEGLTPHYAAPEQLDEESGTTDHATDVYQLGAILYELYTGEPPFTGSTIEVVRKIADEPITPPVEVDSSLPDAMDEILLTALAKEKRDRYEDVLYLRDDLQSLFETL